MYKPSGKDAAFSDSSTQALPRRISYGILSHHPYTPAWLPSPRNQQQLLQPVSPHLSNQQHFLVTQAHLARFLMPMFFICFYNQIPDCMIAFTISFI